MKDRTRRAIAIVAGAVAGRKNVGSVYDYKEGSHFNFSGNVDENNVNIFDHSESCYVGGSGTYGKFSLFHYGNSNHIQLNINGTSLSGYDYDTGAHFSGNVSGSSVSIYDYEHGKHYNYSI